MDRVQLRRRRNAHVHGRPGAHGAQGSFLPARRFAPGAAVLPGRGDHHGDARARRNRRRSRLMLRRPQLRNLARARALGMLLLQSAPQRRRAGCGCSYSRLWQRTLRPGGALHLQRRGRPWPWRRCPAYRRLQQQGVRQSWGQHRLHLCDRRLNARLLQGLCWWHQRRLHKSYGRMATGHAHPRRLRAHRAGYLPVHQKRRRRHSPCR
jgi:hypothetical protein